MDLFTRRELYSTWAQITDSDGVQLGILFAALSESSICAQVDSNLSLAHRKHGILSFVCEH